MIKNLCAVLVLLLVGTTVAAAKGKPLSPPTVNQGDTLKTQLAVEESVLNQLYALNKRYGGINYRTKSNTDRIATLEKWRKDLPADLIGRTEIERLIRDAQLAPENKFNDCLEGLKGAFTSKISEVEGRVKDLEERVGKIERGEDPHNKKQDKRLDDLEARPQASDREVFLAGSLLGGINTDGDLLGGGTAGVAKRFGTLGVADLEVMVGGTERADGLLFGGRVDFLFTLTDIIRVGPGATFLINFGDTHSEFGPDATLEVGPQMISGFLRVFAPYVVGDSTGNTGWTDPALIAGPKGRF